MKSPINFSMSFIILVFFLIAVCGCQSADLEPVEETQTIVEPEEETKETADPTFAAREIMVKVHIEGRGVTDPEVLAALMSVPRHKFVPDQYQSQAYADHPLPIGFGQTISQPFIVALMTAALDLEKGDRVLEIGTGSGYQAAILGELETQVFTIEIIPELTSTAEERLVELGFDNIEVRNADGYFGWEEQAPFDAVIVTAAPDHLPQPLIQQLAEGGRMIIPVGPIGAVQTLWLLENFEGEIKAMNLGPVSFVPLTGEH